MNNTLELHITDVAINKIQEFINSENVSTAGLRVGVLPGGCSGFKYSLNIEDRPLEDDLILDIRGIKVFLDEFSIQYLNGITIDYHSSLTESGFTFDNPNAKGGCGCGTSFSA